VTFIPTVGGAKAVTIFTHGTDVFTNTYWFYKFGWESSDILALATALDTCVNGAWETYLSNQVSYTATRAYGMQTVADPVYLIGTGGGAGGVTGDAVPLNAPLCVTLRTGARGRSARGRIYLSGIPEVNWNGASYDTTIQTHVTDFMHAIMTNTAAIGWQWSVVSFQENGVKRSTGLVRAVTSYEVRDGRAASVSLRSHRP